MKHTKRLIRKIGFVLLMVFPLIQLVAQNTLNQVQYWFDGDLNSSQSMVLPSDTNFSHSIPTQQLTVGLHTFSIRYRQDSSNYSAVVSSVFLKRNTSISASEMEYWIDGDFVNRSTLPFITNGSSVALSLPMQSLTNGLHTLSVRYRDTLGVFSSVVKHSFMKLNKTISASEMEYWIDGDFANRSTLPFTTNGSLVALSLPMQSLTNGLHTLSLRYKDTLGVFSSAVNQSFMKIGTSVNVGPVPQLVAYEYWFDDDFTNRISLTVAGTDSLNMNVSINMQNVSSGLHNVKLRFKENSGIWSATSVHHFMKQPGISNGDSANTITAYRYWFDAQTADTILLSTSTNASIEVLDFIDLNAFAPGPYSFHIQFKQSNGLWSSVHSETIVKCIDPIRSIQVLDANTGIYRAHFDTLVGSQFKLEFRGEHDTTWRSKPLANANVRSQKFNITPWFNQNVTVRLAIQQNGVWRRGCEYNLLVPCKDQSLNIIVQTAPFCEGDSALVRAGNWGGLGAPSYLWSNGATTKRTFAKQGETISVRITDVAGCTLTDSIYIDSIPNTAVPLNFAVDRINQTQFIASWSHPNLDLASTLIGYRLVSRLAGTYSWTSTTLSTDTFVNIDFNSSGRVAGNYEFAVFTRYNNGTLTLNSEYTCIVRKYYNGTGNKRQADVDDEEWLRQEGILVYPNPTESLIYIQSPKESKIKLLDLNGRVISEVIQTQSETTLDLLYLAKGVYLIEITTNNGSHKERIIKK